MRDGHPGTCGWLNDWGAPCFCLFLPVMRRGAGRVGSPLRVLWLAGRHPLMAPDEWGASRATGVRVGRKRGPIQMGSHLALAFPSSLQTSSHNGIDPLFQMNSKWRWDVFRYIKSIPDCSESQGEIHHWHLEFVWWPEMERLDFRCLMLNCTAGCGGKAEYKWMNINAPIEVKSNEKVTLFADSLMEFPFLPYAENILILFISRP